MTLAQFPLLSTDLEIFLPTLKSIPSISTHPVLLPLPSLLSAAFSILCCCCLCSLSLFAPWPCRHLLCACPFAGSPLHRAGGTCLPDCQRLQLHSQHDGELNWGVLIVSCLNARLLEAAQSCKCQAKHPALASAQPRATGKCRATLSSALGSRVMKSLRVPSPQRLRASPHLAVQRLCWLRVMLSVTGGVLWVAQGHHPSRGAVPSLPGEPAPLLSV